ncbi:beta-ketoacyl-ACP synthase II [Flavobacterium sp. MAH-1]|uniref:3-oxoacyl-[acyl-carrier-protein] synthase 2 n=1 Tax=Flavobacterium agri TaxID=2743471 RepID=A0A7Y8XZ50_9FLAO|nr:beta-ketoacyl-ACP synthase II [Flavobacterium agri]NUY79508.1 beta-ketoacyl-ACP synthase II [Flavobacterium agri]NYA69533.1 beta-ketoacyl-ACP synthase II [Flavobacterium agri]
MKRVVITGLGAITPLGNNVAEFWKNIISGKSGAGPITKFDASLFKTRFAHEVKDFEPEKYFERKEVRKYDLFTQYAVAASDEAIADSGLDFANISDAERAEVGVIWASGNGGISTFEEQLQEFNSGDGTPRFNPFFIPKMIVDIAAGVISIRHKLFGPNYATVSACASSNTAIINAFDTIRMGKADVMIAGGSEAAITKSSIGGFGASQALSKNNEHPQNASRPFDANRDGFVAGEGAGALVLEELEHAKARGAKIYAEIVGGGMAADAYHLTGTPADGHGASLGMQKALKDAGITFDKIGSVNAHATSTPQGDLSELNAIRSVFGTHPIKVTATKSMTGHLLGAAGAIESIISALSVKTGIVPATINLENPDPNIPEGLDIVSGKSIQTEQEYVMNNTFGFGGHTATTIFRKFQD